VVEEVAFAGVTKHIAFRIGDVTLKATILNENASHFAVGQHIAWTVHPEAIAVLNTE
jgi:hypothetical protein